MEVKFPIDTALNRDLMANFYTSDNDSTFIPISFSQLTALLNDKAASEKAAELKAKQDAEIRVEQLLADAAKSVVLKKTTINCIKGRVVKKVTGIKPKCPIGYKAKK